MPRSRRNALQNTDKSSRNPGREGPRSAPEPRRGTKNDEKTTKMPGRREASKKVSPEIQIPRPVFGGRRKKGPFSGSSGGARILPGGPKRRFGPRRCARAPSFCPPGARKYRKRRKGRNRRFMVAGAPFWRGRGVRNRPRRVSGARKLAFLRSKNAPGPISEIPVAAAIFAETPKRARRPKTEKMDRKKGPVFPASAGSAV